MKRESRRQKQQKIIDYESDEEEKTGYQSKAAKENMEFDHDYEETKSQSKIYNEKA